MDKLELFSNLVNLAAVDHKFSEEEIRFLVQRANQWGIPNDEFETVLAGIEEAGIELKIPDVHEERVGMLKEMIRLMACDGHLSKSEKDLCARASIKMDFTTNQFKAIVNELIGDSDEY